MAFFVAGAASALWAVFLISEGLDKADKWSSVAAFIGTVVLGVLGLVTARRSANPTPSPTSPPAGNGGPPPSTGVQTINVHGGIAPIVGPGGTQTNTFNTPPPGT
ncbi:hypothetical protein [Micromonospora wenchangensis]|uniref:hypothetical protein n=1 Tax=Micromonospora wenchangensis TaxID=1185415 RepID=UPI0037FD5580